MPTVNEVFVTGDYHRKLADSFAGKKRLEDLAGYYESGLSLIDSHNWTNPLRKPTPTILLMGTGGFHTSQTFIDFIHKRNRTARVIVADVSAYPLNECAQNGLTNRPNVALLQTDTRAINLPPNAVDLLETDALLQFLSSEGKRQALAEWFRVLRPGSSAMTRDWLKPPNPTHNDNADYEKRRVNLFTASGVYPYDASREEFISLARNVGFEIGTARIGNDGTKKFFYHIVLHKPIV